MRAGNQGRMLKDGAWCIVWGEWTRHIGSRLSATLIMVGVWMGGAGVAPSLHACISEAALTCTLSDQKSGRAGRLMRTFSFSSLTSLSCPPEDGGSVVVVWGSRR